MQVRRKVEVGAAQLAINVATDSDLIARNTKNRVIEGIVERLLNLTNQLLWINMRREYFRDGPSRIELMLDIHDWVVKAIRELDHHHFDIQIDQIYNQNDEDHQEHYAKLNRIAEDKGGDERNLR